MVRDDARSGAGSTRKGFPPATATEIDDVHPINDKTSIDPAPAAPTPIASVQVEELRVSDLIPLDSASESDGPRHIDRPKHAPRANRDFVELPRGSLVGEYEIEAKIGEGAMGAVYSAMHPVIGKRVAIKVIGNELSKDASAITRFRREARAVAQLASPHIVDVFGFGEVADGRAYFVMEYLTGESLRDRLARGRVPLDEALELLDQVARGLEVAHEAGIVHRDLKPENIFIERGRNGPPIVKLLDFGLVKLVEQSDETVTATKAGVMFGTPMYCSPEQIRSASSVDHRTDIYALGCVAYEMILGHVPFERTTVVEMIAAHLECAPPQPRTLWPEIPAALDALLWAMVAKILRSAPTLGHAQETIEKVKRSAFANPSSAIAAFAAGPPVATGQMNVPTIPVAPLVSPAPPAQASFSIALGTRAMPVPPFRAPAPHPRRNRRIAAICGALVAMIVAIAIASTRDTSDAVTPSVVVVIDAGISVAPIEVATIAPTDAAVAPKVATPIVKPMPAHAADARNINATRKPPDVPHVAPPQQPTTGELDITSKPPCDVSIDGKPIGRHTPIIGLMLEAGMHTIALVNDKYGIDETVHSQILSGKPVLIKRDYSARMHVDPNGTIDPFVGVH